MRKLIVPVLCKGYVNAPESEDEDRQRWLERHEAVAEALGLTVKTGLLGTFVEIDVAKIESVLMRHGLRLAPLEIA